MDDQNKISIIVCTYNRCESLRDTLQALKAQKLEPGLTAEILVVDNNSKDETRKVVEQTAAGSTWPVKYLFESRQGLSFARNRGIQEASGEIIAFTDDDVIPNPDWAASLQKGMSHTGAEALGGKILPLWEEKPPAWCELKVLWGPLSLLDRGDEVLVPERLDRNLFYGANMAFRKNIFAQLGDFRVDLGAGAAKISRGEDTEILERIFRADKKIAYFPEAVVMHKVPRERIQLNYVRKLAFDAGRSMTVIAGTGKPLSRWHVRKCLENALKAIWYFLSLNHKKALESEFLFWMDLGKIYQGVKS